MSNFDRHNAKIEATRQAELALRRYNRGEPAIAPPKPGSLHPFKRAAAMFTAVMDTRARLQNDLFALQLALAEFPPYVSRGHGWKGRIKNHQIGAAWSQDRSKPYPNPGRSEAARRVFQRMLPHQREVIRRVEGQVRAEVLV